LDYNWPLARTTGEIIPPALVILALLCGTVWALRRKPWVGFLGAWFFIILAPTSTVIPIKDVLFEHRMYLPLAAVIVLVVAGGYAALRRLAPTAAVRGWLAAILVITVVASLGHGTICRNRVYHSAESLWRDVIATRSDNARAYENLGTVLMVEARKNDDLSERAGRINTAIQAYRRAVELDPDFVSARANLANALSQTGRFEEAVEHYGEVLRVKPFHADAHINRAHALDRMGRTEEAIEAYRAATRLTPPNVTPRFLARAHANLGGVLGNQGDLDGAIAEYREAVRLWPQYDFAHYWWGVILNREGRLDEAIEHFRETLTINENHDAARRALERALARKQRSNPD
jgi:tetratricopeptide (TPR) repeat protein